MNNDPRARIFLAHRGPRAGSPLEIVFREIADIARTLESLCVGLVASDRLP